MDNSIQERIISYAGWLLMLTASGFYGYGIFDAVILSWPKPPIPPDAYHAVLSTTIGTMQALLLANLGMLLGVSVSNPQSAVARALKLNGTSAVGVDLAPLPPTDVKDKIQLFALVIYLISLIICFVTWIRNDFSSLPADVISIVPESGKMFIGVVLAYMTAILRR